MEDNKSEIEQLEKEINRLKRELNEKILRKKLEEFDKEKGLEEDPRFIQLCDIIKENLYAVKIPSFKKEDFTIRVGVDAELSINLHYIDRELRYNFDIDDYSNHLVEVEDDVEPNKFLDIIDDALKMYDEDTGNITDFLTEEFKTNKKLEVIEKYLEDFKVDDSIIELCDLYELDPQEVLDTVYQTI